MIAMRRRARAPAAVGRCRGRSASARATARLPRRRRFALREAGRERVAAGPTTTRFSVHLELFANRRVIVDSRRHRRRVAVPPGGGGRPTGRLRVPAAHDRADRRGSRSARAARRSATSFASGGSGSGASSARSRSAPRAPCARSSNGRERPAIFGRIRLTPHAQIVLEIGGYVRSAPLVPLPERNAMRDAGCWSRSPSRCGADRLRRRLVDADLPARSVRPGRIGSCSFTPVGPGAGRHSRRSCRS